MTLFRIRAYLRTSVWLVPVMCVLGGVMLSFGTIAIDRITEFDLIPASLTGGPDAATAILSTIATAEVTLCALVLTVTMVVVQLAMGQFSPRIVQTFLQDKPSQIAIGLFVATFAHAMLAMREVNNEAKTVPGVAIVVAFVLVVLSIVVLVVYVDHIGKSLRVSSLIELVGKATRRTLDERYPDHGHDPPADQPGEHVIRAPHSGVVSHIDDDKLIALAKDADVDARAAVGRGAFVPAGSAAHDRARRPRTRRRSPGTRSRRARPRSQPRPRRRVRHSVARRHRRALPGRFAVSRSDDCGAGTRSVARLPAPTRDRARSPTVVSSTTTVRLGRRSRSWTGTRTCGSRSKRSGSPAPVRRR